MRKVVSSYHIGVSAEAFAAAQFARYGFDVSVQYGANQPDYDLLVHQNDKILKISVKGSQDGSWGLTQGYKRGRTYHEAIDEWLKAHGNKTVFCLVQFKDSDDMELPRMYLATPSEMAEYMRASHGGQGDTILHEHHKWTKGIAAGTTDTIPSDWIFTPERALKIFNDI